MPTFDYRNSIGKKVPSVSTIISGNCAWSSRMLMEWIKREFRAGRDPDDTSGEACKIGTLTHSLIEHHIFGQDEFEPEEGVTASDVMSASVGLRNYIEWEKANNVEYLESELKMVSETMQVGGCCDCIAKVNGVVTLIDFKTSKSLYTDHVTQISAYRDMIHELTDYKIEQVMVIRINKEASDGDENAIEVYTIPNEAVEQGSEVFSMLRELHNYNSTISKVVRQLTKH